MKTYAFIDSVCGLLPFDFALFQILVNIYELNIWNNTLTEWANQKFLLILLSQNIINLHSFYVFLFIN